MQGRMIDIEKLRTANENVQAVGNMNVNARGDILGKGGQVVTPKAKIIKKYYEQPKGRVDDTPIRAMPMPQAIVQPKQVAVPKPKAQPKPAKTVKPKTDSKSKKGIDAALDGIE